MSKERRLIDGLNHLLNDVKQGILNHTLFNSFPAAREACQSKGPQWDLVVFESDEELAYVKKLINCLPEAFWVGYRENNGVAIDVLGKVTYPLKFT